MEDIWQACTNLAKKITKHEVFRIGAPLWFSISYSLFPRNDYQIILVKFFAFLVKYMNELHFKYFLRSYWGLKVNNFDLFRCFCSHLKLYTLFRLLIAFIRFLEFLLPNYIKKYLSLRFYSSLYRAINPNGCVPAWYKHILFYRLKNLWAHPALFCII